ncbi:MAG: methyltransferase domain-containing protein, partial [Pseudomonadota bacterium]
GFLHHHVEDNILQRLADINRQFKHIAVLGVFDQRFAQSLKTLKPEAQITYLDISPKRLESIKKLGFKTCLFDGHMLPLKPHTFDLVLSPMFLHWIEDLPCLFMQMRHLLKDDGLLIAAFPSQDTLKELKAALIHAETVLKNGCHRRCLILPNLQEATHLLSSAGFALPVGDVERLTILWPDLYKLMHDLRGMGENNALSDRAYGFTPSALFKMAQHYYRQHFNDKKGGLKASFNIIYLHGWAPSINQPKPLKRGSGTISLAEHLS